MPTDYQCEACNLAIQIGWFHFHSDAKGYWAATLGFCQKCGTIHRVDHASNEALPDVVSAQPGPLSIAESEMKGVDYRIPLQDWADVTDSRQCGHCGALNAVLFGDINVTPVVETCPRCSSPRMKKLYSWMT